MERRGLMSPESAQASDIFDKFCAANTLKGILNHYRQLCNVLKLKPTHFPEFYPRIRQKLSSWRAQGLWSKFEKRASNKCYARGQACAGSRVLIIGGGPCGLRTAIEAQLLGAKVVLIEKRDRFSRNNVLHLWPFVITDLKALGAKKFYGKFCAGSIDHISIRQLQCILLKVALLLGVEVHEGVGFEGLEEPTDDEGWRATTSPADHPVSHYNFNCLIGADGRRNTLDGFKRKALRAKLAIAITANFINKRTEAEARVKEISGVSYIFNQKFFQDLNEATGIDLENIVYYKDETHYFVMTAKKQSLLSKGVLLNDHADTAQLLSKENISTEALMIYALEAAGFSTDGQLPNLEFAVNHYGQPDVAMFDFTAMYAAENACRVVQRNGHKLMMTLVGDSLLEPFWPTGSGCARGFLSSFDACWMLRSLCSGLMTTLEVIALRESQYRLLAQTTPENLNKEHAAYTIDPHTRYPNLNQKVVMPFQVKSLYDTDEKFPEGLEGPPEQYLDGPGRLGKKRRRETAVPVDTLLAWLRDQVGGYGFEINTVTEVFIRGDVLCAIIHRFRPDLLEFPPISEENMEPLEIVAQRNELAFDILHKEYDIAPVISGPESAQVNMSDFHALVAYLSQLHDAFRGEIPQVKYPRVDGSDEIDEPSYKSSHGHVKYARLSLVVKQGPSARVARRNRAPAVRDSEHLDVRRHRKSRRTELHGARVNTGREIRTSISGTPEAEKLRVSGLARNLEEKLRGGRSSDKKPKDLIRAIGKIEKSDWNVQQIEKKIAESKTHEQSKKEHDKVPKWSREAYDDKREAMKRKMEGVSEKTLNEREKLFEETVKRLGNKLKEGNTLDIGQRGCNKVSQMAEQLSHKFDTPTRDLELTPKQVSTRPMFELPTKGGSEVCHFCNLRVYVVERMTTEGKYFHRNCFRCEYCNTSLRLGNYVFDREGRYGERFYCAPHYQTVRLYGWKKFDQQNASFKAEQDKLPAEGRTSFLTPTTHQILSEMDDRGTTPERVEFENSVDFASEEELLSEMDEDEWTDRNFGASKVESNTSDEASDLSEDDEITPDGNTAENNQVAPLMVQEKDESDSDTEIASGTGSGSEEDASSNDMDEDECEDDDDGENECEGSTTEVETDSEFAEDPPHLVPGKIPTIVVEEHGRHLAQHVESGQRGSKPPVIKPSRPKHEDVYGELPVVEPVLRSDLPKGRALPKVYSAPKKWEPLANLESQPEAMYSSELKKKYLEGKPAHPRVSSTKKASDPATQNKFTSVLDMISEKQKLLQPAPEVSPTMQAFLDGAEKLKNKTTLTGLRAFDSSTPEDKKQLQITPSPSDILILSKAEEEMISMNLRNLEMSIEMSSGCMEGNEKSDDGKEVYNLSTNTDEGSPAQLGDITDLNVESMLISSDTLSCQSQSKTESQCTIKEADNKLPRLCLPDDMHSETGSDIESVSCGEEVSDTDDAEAEHPPVAHYPPRVEIEDEFGVSLSLDEDKLVDNKNQGGGSQPIAPPPATTVCVVSSSDSKESLNSGAFLETELSEWSRETGHPVTSQRDSQKTSTLHLAEASGTKPELALQWDSIDFADIESESPSSAAELPKVKGSPGKMDGEAVKELTSNSTGDSVNSVRLSGNKMQDAKTKPMDVPKKEEKTELIDAVNPASAPAKEKEKIALLDRVVPFSKARDSLDYRKMKNTTSPTKATSPRNYKHLSFGKAPAKLNAAKGSDNNHDSKVITRDEPATLTVDSNDKASKISRSPVTVRRLEQINQERSKQNDLIKSMVMDRIRRSPEKNKRGSRGSLTVSSTEEFLAKSDRSSAQSYESGSGTSFSSVSDDPNSQKSDVPETENTVLANLNGTKNDSTYAPTENLKSKQRFSLNEGDMNDSFDLAIRSIRDTQRCKSYFESPPVDSDSSNPILTPRCSFDSKTTGAPLKMLPADGNKEENNVISSTFYAPEAGSSAKTSLKKLPDAARDYNLTTPRPTTNVLSSHSQAPGAPLKKLPEDEKEEANVISPSFYRSMPDLSNAGIEEEIIGKPKVGRDSSFTLQGEKTKVAQRSISLVGHERAREEARERARLKTDEELQHGHLGNIEMRRRKLSYAEDEVFNPNAAITARVSSHSEPTSNTSHVINQCSYSIGELEGVENVAASIRHNVDFPMKKGDPFLAAKNDPRQTKTDSMSSNAVSNDFVELNLHVAPKTIKAPNLEPTAPGAQQNFPTFFSTPSTSNWRKEYSEKKAAHKTHARSHTVTGIKLESAPTGSSGTVGFQSDAFANIKIPLDGMNRTQALPYAPQLDTNSSASRAPNKAKALSTETLLDNVKFALAPEGDSFRGVSVPDVSHDFAPSEPKPKRSKDRSRRRSLIQAVSDFFTIKSPSTTKSPTSGDPDKSSSTSSPSTSTPRDTKFSIFKLTPKLLQKERLSSSPDSGIVRNSTQAQEKGKPSKNPRASFMSYLSQPEILVQRLSSSPTVATSSRAGLSTNFKDATPNVRQGKSKREISLAEKKRKNELMEIQLQMESVETEQRQLERRGVSIERKLRGEEDDEGLDHQQLMEEWFTLVREKIRLSRYEKEMLVRARELELDYKKETLEGELETSLLVNECEKSPDDKTREADLFKELNEIKRQQEALMSAFHEDMLKYEKEDAELEARCSSLSPRESNV